MNKKLPEHIHNSLHQLSNDRELFIGLLKHFEGMNTEAVFHIAMATYLSAVFCCCGDDSTLVRKHLSGIEPDHLEHFYREIFMHMGIRPGISGVENAR